MEEFPHIPAKLPPFFDKYKPKRFIDDYKPKRPIDTSPSVLEENEGFLDIFIEDEDWLPLLPECPV